MEDTACGDVRLLWVVTLDPSVGEYHGAGMRFLNFARELSKAGASVYFALNVRAGEAEGDLRNFLSRLQAEGVIAGAIVLHYEYSVKQGRWGAMALHPGLADWFLRDARREPVAQLLRFARENKINAGIVSDRMLLFLGAELQRQMPVVFDWTDSMVLYYWRALTTKLRQRKFSGMLGFLRDYQTNAIAEAYYGRRADVSTVVSPVDKSWLDRTNRKPAHNRVWMNGTNTDEIPPVAKVARRLIFSGTMDYPPNYEGALWFLDNVLPLLSARHPDTQIVIAGVNPVPELLARANERVRITGFVPDLGAEIARSALYVAPLFSGGGFRNKVIESIMRGTYLIGTSISVEFLPAEFRRLLSIADTAPEMAEAIADYFDHPEKYSDRLRQLREIVVTQFSWRGRSQELLGFIAEARERYARRQRGKDSA